MKIDEKWEFQGLGTKVIKIKLSPCALSRSWFLEADFTCPCLGKQKYYACAWIFLDRQGQLSVVTENLKPKLNALFWPNFVIYKYKARVKH